MLLCCTPVTDAWGQNDVAKQGFLHIRELIPDWGLHWLDWCTFMHRRHAEAQAFNDHLVRNAGFTKASGSMQGR